jgi:hypothetical protein
MTLLIFDSLFNVSFSSLIVFLIQINSIHRLDASSLPINVASPVERSRSCLYNRWRFC